MDKYCGPALHAKNARGSIPKLPSVKQNI